MDKSAGFALLTVPNIISLSSKRPNECSIRTLYTQLSCIWGFKKVPYELETEFRELNRQEMIDHPYVQPMKVSLIYHDRLLERKGDYIGIHMRTYEVSNTDKAICCFLYAFSSAMKGFIDKNCLMEYPYGIMTSIDLKVMKETAMLLSCITTRQGIHPVIWGLGNGYSDLDLAKEILDARIEYTRKNIEEFCINSSQLQPETVRLLYGMMYDLGMFYAYKEIEFALLQGSFNSDYLRIIQSQEENL